HAAEIIEQGWTIMPGVLSLHDIERARMILSTLWQQEHAIGLAREWHNSSYVISYMLPAKHEFFRQLAMNHTALSLVRKVLGERCVLSSLNGMKMVPAGEGQVLHLDQPEYTPSLIIGVNAMYALDDFTIANGCTRVVPQSHKRPAHE